MRRLGFGLGTLLGVRRLGFFIPHRYAAAVEPCGYPTLEAAFEASERRCRELIEQIGDLSDDLAACGGPPPAPRFDQAWFPGLDGAGAYALVRRRRPGRIVEVGSGHSTRFLARAIADGGLATRLTAIDPAPRAGLLGLDIDWRASLVQDADEEVFTDLRAGDMLFVDSSHVLMPGTDVDRLINRVLPRLPAGLLVHLHDVLLPDPYPDSWAWRGYNEQQLIAPLIWSGAFEVVFSSHWVRSRRPGWLARDVLAGLPLLPGAIETSLWLEKRC